MAIQSTDILQRLSGGASNASPIAALGGIKSTTTAPTALFGDVSGAEAAAGSVRYRCVYIHNAHATLTLQGAIAWVPTDTVEPSSLIQVGVGTSTVNGTEQTISSDTTAPTGVVFVPANIKSGAVALGDIPPGQHRALWISRTMSAGAPVASSTYSIRVEGATLP